MDGFCKSTFWVSYWVNCVIFVFVKYELCVSEVKIFIVCNKMERRTAAISSCQEVMLHDPNVFTCDSLKTPLKSLSLSICFSLSPSGRTGCNYKLNSTCTRLGGLSSTHEISYGFPGVLAASLGGCWVVTLKSACHLPLACSS
jgi:hypothetical protein